MANKIWSVLPPIVVLLATFHHLTFACICSPPHDIPISDPIWKDYVETVKVLKCSNCTDIPTNHDPSSITKLDLSSGDNKLTHLTPNIFVNKAFFNLREINLSNCGIMDVDKDAFLGIQPIKLLTLDLSYNSVSSIDTGSVSVRNLNLRGNPIKNLTFATYFMQQLDLSNCSLDETLPNAPFVDRLLNKINLESNKLTTLSWKEFRKTSLLNISLKGNPWSQPGIEMYKEPLPNSETGQLYRYQWEHRLEISDNSSVYGGPWIFVCTAENQYGIARQQIIVTRPTVRPVKRQPVYVRNASQGNVQIFPEEIVNAQPPVLRDSKNVSTANITERTQCPQILISNVSQEIIRFDDSYFTQISLVLCILLVVCLIVFVAMIVLLVLVVRNLQRLIPDNLMMRDGRIYASSSYPSGSAPKPPPSYRSRMEESLYGESYANVTYLKKY